MSSQSDHTELVPDDGLSLRSAAIEDPDCGLAATAALHDRLPSSSSADGGGD